MTDTDKTLGKVLHESEIKIKLKDAAPQVLIEILYEYLSQNISTHFEKTMEGIDTLHNVLIQRKKEHDNIIERLDRLEQQIKEIRQQLDT
jgi:hypothetical protein